MSLEPGGKNNQKDGMEAKASPTDTPTLLLVEDDAVLQKRLSAGLKEQGYRVRGARNTAAARRALEEAGVDLILLDIGLPDGSGLDFLRELREVNKALPVVLLTARSAIEDKITGLDLGADDYLIKPVDFHELLARIRARLRSSRAGDPLLLTVHDLTIDLARRVIHRGGRLIDCTPKEFDVMVCLAQRVGGPVSRQVLSTEVWKVRSRLTSMDNVIDVLFSRLREKIDTPGEERLIHTVRGRGYMLKEPT